MPLRKSSLRVEVPSGRGVRPTKEVQKRGRTLHSKVKALTEQVKKLDGATYRDKELTEADSILTADVTSLRKSMDKAKADAIKEYKDSHPFFNLLGSQYGEGFEDFRKQAAVLFPLTWTFLPSRLSSLFHRPLEWMTRWLTLRTGTRMRLNMSWPLKWFKETVHLRLKRQWERETTLIPPLKKESFYIYFSFLLLLFVILILI